ncbi:GNAT family N-acetyltransferase [Oceanobacillus indicireducens]|uniref:N-acetyltransferase n=1 Tax=Oceanobacillus indicireducens TaxID=1004261 RepID=A0A918D1B6_9BACI|nr:GNAT family N-acetyltransferase [Oceanobacillus indicireducens]GGN56164.1 N-acetyltransferase [Oceanobacillus indicireducens]
MNINSISIRKMKHTDYEVMAQWLSTKEVLEFYGDSNSPFTLQQVKNKYEPRVNGDIPVIPYIVELDNTPIGFMQQYKLNEEKQKEFGYPKHSTVYGIDQDVDMIILDPAVSNVRAIRCYEKCGFRKIKKIINNDKLFKYNFNVVSEKQGE